MFSKKEVKSLASEAYSEFSKKHKVSCKISMIDLDEFWRLAKKSKVIQEDIRQKIPLKVGALVVHGKKDTICLNEDIINQMSNDSNFVKAIVLHELFHVLLRSKVKEDNLGESIRSENRVHDYLNKEFPKYSKYLV
jgi:hypothetical protein